MDRMPLHLIQTRCVVVFCLTLILGYSVPSFGQTPPPTTGEKFHLLESSTKGKDVLDSSYYLVELKKDRDAKRYLATNTRVVRNLGNGRAIVQGLQLKDSVQYHSVHAVNDLWKLSRPLIELETGRQIKKSYTLILGYDLRAEEVSGLLPQIKIRHVRNNSVLVGF